VETHKHQLSSNETLLIRLFKQVSQLARMIIPMAGSIRVRLRSACSVIIRQICNSGGYRGDIRPRPRAVIINEPSALSRYLLPAKEMKKGAIAYA
jgi:hypothetical protein